jgi:hypothetical protein
MSAAQTTVEAFEIGIHSTEPRGWFEHMQLGDECGGGLWFEKVRGKLRLIDYDGVFSLPRPVIDGIRALGAIVPRDFE